MIYPDVYVMVADGRFEVTLALSLWPTNVNVIVNVNVCLYSAHLLPISINILVVLFFFFCRLGGLT